MSLMDNGTKLAASFVRERAVYCKITLCAYILWIIGFEIVGHYATTLSTNDPTSSWDRAIPLVPAAIWPYEACYLLPFLACLLIRNWHSLNIALVAALLANLVAAAAYLLFPVAFPRPVLGSSLAERVLALEYAWDFSPGANNLPSMHVAMSWLWLFACRKQGIGRPVELALTALVISISISTLLVKQHLLIDVLAGFACACVAWKAAHVWYARKHYFAMAPLEALRRMTRAHRPSAAAPPAA